MQIYYVISIDVMLYNIVMLVHIWKFELTGLNQILEFIFIWIFNL